MDINTINEWLMRLKCVGKGVNFYIIFQICILSQFLTCFTHFMKTLKWSLKMWSRSQCMTVTGWFWSSHPLPFLLLLRHVIWRLVLRLVLRIQVKKLLNFTLTVVPRLKLTSVRLPWSEVIPALEGHVLNHRNYLKITLVFWGGEATPFQLLSRASEIYTVSW